MAQKDAKVETIEKIVKKGSVRHAEIIPQLERANIPGTVADEVAGLVVRHKYGPENKVAKGTRSLGDKVGGYVSAIVGAGVVAEIMAAKAFSGSLLEQKLQGFGDHLKYWLGMKSIEINGPEMMDAMKEVVVGTPDIVKGMALGAVLGYVVWKAGTRTIGFFYKKQKLQKDAQRIASR